MTSMRANWAAPRKIAYFSDCADGDRTERESRAMGLGLEATCVKGRRSNQLNYPPQT
jgi:hypothetical protein